MTTKTEDLFLKSVIRKVFVLLFFLSCNESNNAIKFFYTNESNCKNNDKIEENIIINDTLSVYHTGVSAYHKVSFYDSINKTHLLFPTIDNNIFILKIDTNIFILDNYKVFRINNLKYLSKLEYEDFNPPSEVKSDFYRDRRVIEEKLQYLDLEYLKLKDDGYPIVDNYPMGMFKKNGNLNVVTCNLYSKIVGDKFKVFISEIKEKK